MEHRFFDAATQSHFADRGRSARHVDFHEELLVFQQPISHLQCNLRRKIVHLFLG